MTMNPNDPNRYGPRGEPEYRPQQAPGGPTRRVGVGTLIVGGLALLAIVAILTWGGADRTAGFFYNPTVTTTQQEPIAPPQGTPAARQSNPDTNLGQTPPANR
jgi:hypothetical protein